MSKIYTNGISHPPSHFKGSVQLEITKNVYDIKCNDLYRKKG